MSAETKTNEKTHISARGKKCGNRQKERPRQNNDFVAMNDDKVVLAVKCTGPNR